MKGGKRPLALLVALAGLMTATPAAASDFSPLYYVALSAYLVVCIPLCLWALMVVRTNPRRAAACAATGLLLAPMVHGPYWYAPVGLYLLFGLTIDGSAISWITIVDALTVGAAAFVAWHFSVRWQKRHATR
ncbi:MAG: hypothetical protein MUF41_05005 [Sphingopyxis sp.]|jgi:hypothetical protein|nr:hypothetical protein [Sphingopyxis sp.]